MNKGLEEGTGVAISTLEVDDFFRIVKFITLEMCHHETKTTMT